MKHSEPNGVQVAPKKAAEIVWKFTKRGTFEYSCLIPDQGQFPLDHQELWPSCPVAPI